MTDLKWLSEDERQMLEGHLWYSHEIYAREFASCLADERERNAELVEALEDAKKSLAYIAGWRRDGEDGQTYAELHIEIRGYANSRANSAEAALAKNGGKP